MNIAIIGSNEECLYCKEQLKDYEGLNIYYFTPEDRIISIMVHQYTIAVYVVYHRAKDLNDHFGNFNHVILSFDFYSKAIVSYVINPFVERDPRIKIIHNLLEAQQVVQTIVKEITMTPDDNATQLNLDEQLWIEENSETIEQSEAGDEQPTEN